MVWEIAHVFHHRPSFRQLDYLYGNVVATSVIAARLQDVDLSDYVKPVIAGVMGYSLGAIPGVAAISGHLSNAVFAGSVNAFLTLRVAMVAVAYSRATVRPERPSVWKHAVLRAGHLVARTIANGSSQVAKAFAVSAGRSVIDAAGGAGRALVTGGQQVGKTMFTTSRAAGSAAAGAAKGVGMAAGQAGSAAKVAGRGAGVAARWTVEAFRKKGRGPTVGSGIEAVARAGTMHGPVVELDEESTSSDPDHGDPDGLPDQLPT